LDAAHIAAAIFLPLVAMVLLVGGVYFYFSRRRRHQSLKKLCPSPPVMPTMAYFLGVIAHLGPFIGPMSGGIYLWAEHSWSTSINSQHPEPPHALDQPGTHE
ncbi:SEZ6 isoform 6, partial [Pongo abelii]